MPTPLLCLGVAGSNAPDALVAAEVIDVAGPVLLTSDRDDLTLLLADHVDVRVVLV